MPRDHTLLLSESVVLREEHFGGLLFDHRDDSVTEVGHGTYKLLLLCDGTHAYNRIVDSFPFSQHQKITKLIGELVLRGFVHEVTIVGTN